MSELLETALQRSETGAKKLKSSSLGTLTTNLFVISSAASASNLIFRPSLLSFALFARS
jgi:hypothetical protein